MVEVYERRGGREVEAIGAACYPDPGRNWERWAANLYGYPATDRLERAGEMHQQELRGAGWRFVGKAWTPPPRQRRSTEDAGAFIARLVQRLDPLRAPAPVAASSHRALARFEVGLLQALADLLFYPTTLEALALSTSVLSAAAVDWLARNDVPLFAEARRRRATDPLRPRFSSVGHVLSLGRTPLAFAPQLGAGAPSYRVAESRGRTRSRWNEVECRPSHVGAGTAQNLAAVEFWADARRRIGEAIATWTDPPDVRAALDDALPLEMSRAKPELRVETFRSALSAARIGRDTADWTDEAIGQRLAKARQELEQHLRRAPPKAEAVAFATGDRSLLAPLVEDRAPERRGGNRRPTRPPVERINPLEALQ